MKIPNLGLQAFYFLASEKNFTRAALKLGLSQPAFSQRIKALEDELAATLIIRDRHGILLTSAGEKLLKYCKTNIQMEEELLAEIGEVKATTKSGGLTGQIRIGGFSSVLRSIVIPALSTLLKESPRLSIQTYTGELSELVEMLRSARVDFVIDSKPWKRAGVISQLLGYEENVLVASKKYPDVNIFLDHDENDVTTASYLELTKNKEQYFKRYLDDVYGILDGVKLGLGRAILPKHLIDSNELIIIDPKRILKIPFYLIYFESQYYTKVHQQVVSELTLYFKLIMESV